MTLEILLVQLKVAEVKIKVEDRINHIQALIAASLQNQQERRPNLILLPEAAFCSYCQPNASHALAVGREQEPAVKAWGRKIAIEFGCYIAFGYIGVEPVRNTPKNALAVFAPDGTLIRDQKKRFLYVSDEVWTSEREASFQAVELSMLPTSPRVLFAICNDINAFDFSAEQMDSFPLASAVIQQRASLLCLSAAWCSAHPESPEAAHDEEIFVDDQVNYWLERLEPVLGKKVYFCSADLVGREQIPGKSSRIKYCGSTCCLDLATQRLLKSPLNTSHEGCLYVSIPL